MAALMAILGAAGVPYDKWLPLFTVPLYLGLLALGAVAIVGSLAVGLS